VKGFCGFKGFKGIFWYSAVQENELWGFSGGRLLCFLYVSSGRLPAEIRWRSLAIWRFILLPYTFQRFLAGQGF